MYKSEYRDWRADEIDSLADKHNATEEELAYIRAMDEKCDNALMFGTPLAMITPTDTIWNIVQWIIRYGEPIKKTIPLAGGRMTTKEEVVETEYGMYYYKTGWYNKEKVSVHTFTPDEFILELVKGQMETGKAY